MKRFIYPLFCFSLCLLMLGCVYAPVKGRSEGARIDRRYLEFWYDNQLLPAFESYESEVSQLHDLLHSADLRQAGAINDLQAQYRKALIALQPVILFDRQIFANNYYGLSTISASFPVNRSALESLIHQEVDMASLEKGLSLGTISPNTVGYAALDMLLYDSAVGDWQEHLPLIRTISEQLLRQAQTATSYYKDRREDFLSNDGFGIHSSMSVLMNTLLQNWEASIRTAKVGYPIGVYGIVHHAPSPLTAEAYYSRLSHELLRQSVESFQDFFEGIPARGSLPANTEYSFKNMLHEYLPSPKNREIPQQVAKELSELNLLLRSLDSDIPRQLETSEGLQRLQSIHASLQRIVGLLKTNAVSALGLTITYSDGEEGD